MSSVRVLLVTQSPVLRYGIRGTLEQVLPLDQVVEAEGALEAAALHEQARAGLTVIHDALPGVNANVTSKMIQVFRPGSTIAILSDFAGEGHVEAAQQHGATALISLATAPNQFALTMRALLSRHPRTGTDRLISTAHVAGLTGIEIATLDGIARGLPRPAIATALRLADSLIEQALATVIAKLRAGDPASAVVQAARLGLVNLTDQLPTPHPASDLGVASAA